MTTATEYKQRTLNAISRGMAAQSTELAATDYDLDAWPVDVVEMVAEFCKLWHMHPPGTKTSKALWIRDARELMDAAGEFSIEALREYRITFEAYMTAHRGVAFHTVSGLGSLVKMVRDTARQMRERVEQDDSTKYITGEFAAYIHH